MLSLTRGWTDVVTWRIRHYRFCSDDGCVRRLVNIPYAHESKLTDDDEPSFHDH